MFQYINWKTNLLIHVKILWNKRDTRRLLHLTWNIVYNQLKFTRTLIVCEKKHSFAYLNAVDRDKNGESN